MRTSNHFKDIEYIEEPVKEWQNLGGMNLLEAFYNNPERWSFSFELYSMFSKIKALFNAVNSKKPIIIIERSIFSNKIFINLSKDLGKLNNMEYIMLINTYDFFSKNLYPQLNGIIYLDTPVDECLKRIVHRNRIEELKIEKKYLADIKRKMEELFIISDLNIYRINGVFNLEHVETKLTEFFSKFLYID